MLFKENKGLSLIPFKKNTINYFLAKIPLFKFVVFTSVQRRGERGLEGARMMAGAGVGGGAARQQRGFASKWMTSWENTQRSGPCYHMEEEAIHFCQNQIPSRTRTPGVVSSGWAAASSEPGNPCSPAWKIS